MGKKHYRRHARVEVFGDEYVAIIRKHGPEALFYAGSVVLREAERRAPVGRTGNIKKSGYVSTFWRSTYVTRRYWRREKAPRQPDTVTVGFTAPHSHLMESGRRRRGEIRPRRRRNGQGRRALRINGQLRASSRYKRMSSRPFVGPAVDASKDTMVDELARRFNSVLERLLPGRR